LTLEVPVTVPEAMRGATVTVPTPEGDVALRIPAGTQSGRRLRLRGKGVPRLQGGDRGDLYVRVMVQVPEDGDRVRDVLGALEAAYGADVRKDLRL
ncbi:molecular chaperone DnaJ, partial [bacterium]|nr:molecular chaperone DnaJ [bacterium]